MSVNDPISISPQQIQEGRSTRAIEESLSPWIVSWVQQGKDFGLDGWVRIVDESTTGGGSVSPLTFNLQAKSHQRPSTEPFGIPVDCRHLGNWTGGPGTVLIAAYSAHDGQIAYRTARQAVVELDATRVGWREQASTTVHFRPEHILGGVVGRRTIRRWIADEADTRGGVQQFHTVQRRVLLTDLYHGQVGTSTTIEARGQGDGSETKIFVGPGWTDGELDPSDVYAPRVLAGALLLYEQVLLPIDFLGVALRSIGSDSLRALMDAGRIVPVATESVVGFRAAADGLLGSPVSMSLATEDALHEKIITRNVNLVGSDRQLLEAVRRSTRFLPKSLGERVVRETKADLAKSEIRGLLGLSCERPTGGPEPLWDRHLVNRLLHLNVALAAAEHLSVDVVEYEGGLARIAAEKWFTELRFNRLFASFGAFEAVLRSAGVPDLGLLEPVMGLARLAEASKTPAAQDFRDWFWQRIRHEDPGGLSLEDQLHKKLAEALGQDLSSMRLLTELKLLFFSGIGEEYVVGSSPGTLHGYASRSQRGTEVLARQAAAQTRARCAAIGTTFGDLDPYGRCPCGGGAKYRFCCGPKRGPRGRGSQPT